MNEDMPPKKKRKVISLEQKLSVTYVEINDLFLKNESKTGFCCFLYRRYFTARVLFPGCMGS